MVKRSFDVILNQSYGIFMLLSSHVTLTWRALDFYMCFSSLGGPLIKKMVELLFVQFVCGGFLCVNSAVTVCVKMKNLMTPFKLRWERSRVYKKNF